MKSTLGRLVPSLAAVAVFAVVAVTLGTMATAFAFDSGGNPGGVGDNTIEWTGQGAASGVLNASQCGDEADFAGATPAGDADANNYLLWVFTTDGGSATINDPQGLHLGGTGSGFYAPDANAGNTFKFVTPYFTPDSNLAAFADFSVDQTGRGAWNLVISHGCAPTECDDCVGAESVPLTVSKTASTAYDKTYAWSIGKSVDKTIVKQVGGSATFNYTVTVSHDAGTDSNWTVSGVITVTNTNSDAVTGVDVTDAIDNGGNCTVTDGTGQTINNGSQTFNYTCSFSTAQTTGTNTASATWGLQELTDGVLVAGSATGPANYDFGAATVNTIDECVNVTDSYAGALGTVCVADATNPKTFTYSRTISVPQYGCQSYDNTATFTANDTGATNSAGQTVTVCGPVKTGGLTIGFWQNKNGQNIIKAGAATAGVCNSGTWLRTYAPFQETALSATATCTQVATYVTNVINAANAKGASMNAMLKAQMLATALDVYFSSSALGGGNQINAPAPIGGVSIDLTQVCTDLSCSTYEDTSTDSFGGSPCLTVQGMLTYAASQSNAGGGTWYGNQKFPKQEYAKDAFEMVNNEKAFAC